MHLWAILAVVILVWCLRYQSISCGQGWSERWYRVLFLFLFPSLLLLTTACTVLYMGCHGAMLGVKAGSVGCVISGSLIIYACGCLLRLAYQSARSLRQLEIYPQQNWGGVKARILETNLPYSAQIGFWHSQLIISHGLVVALDEPHLEAVVAHEEAHSYYRDTFWFFWLGWIRSFSFWLPQTEVLWQELLLLRELRADRKAVESVDFILLAESLLVVAKAPLEAAPVWCVSLNDSQIGDRLNERINSLLESTEPVPPNQWVSWSWLGLLFLPLLTIPLHY